MNSLASRISLLKSIDPTLNRCLCVEFVGIACSGKSTISKELRAVLRRAEIPCLDTASFTKWQKLWAATTHPLLMASWARAVLTVPMSIKSRIKIFRNLYAVLSMMLCLRAQEGVLILDEGLLHKFRALRRQAGRDLTMNQVLRGRPTHRMLPNVALHVVFVDIRATTYRDRLWLRDRIRISPEDADIAVDRTMLSHYDAHVLEASSQLVSVHSLGNDPEDDPIASARNIAARVIERLGVSHRNSPP
jgi:hypothetical protein